MFCVAGYHQLCITFLSLLDGVVVRVPPESHVSFKIEDGVFEFGSTKEIDLIDKLWQDVNMWYWCMLPAMSGLSYFMQRSHPLRSWLLCSSVDYWRVCIARGTPQGGQSGGES